MGRLLTENMMHTVAVVSLGCPKNQIDAETMLGLLAEKGYSLLNRPEKAEVIIVNTCGFIDQAREESVQQILAMAEYTRAGTCRQLIVTGCLAQRYSAELARELPEVDAFVGTGQVDKIAEVITANQSCLGSPDRYDGVAETRRIFSTFPYGYLKIAEGCNNWCSYCVIPRLRGKLRSKPQEQIIAEARRMVDSGIREIVLIAQDTAQYGLDWGGRSQLPELLRRLEAAVGNAWLRVMYCYPDRISPELLDVVAGSDVICKYLDIPLQHSHPDILASMGRNRRGADLLKLIETVRRHVPGIALRTTFIVGYPGETEEHFQHLLDFVRWAEFDHLGAFMYSREEGTPAARLKPQVSAGVKARRYRELMETQQKIVLQRNARQAGKEFTALVDDVRGAKATARSQWQAPEVDSAVILPAGSFKPGDMVNVRCTGFDGYDLVGVKI